MSSRIKTTTCYIRKDQLENLRRLSNVTKVPVAEYIRQGVDMVLTREDLKNVKYDIRVDRTGLSPGHELILECGKPSPIPLPKDPLFPYGGGHEQANAGGEIRERPGLQTDGGPDDVHDHLSPVQPFRDEGDGGDG